MPNIGLTNGKALRGKMLTLRVWARFYSFIYDSLKRYMYQPTWQLSELFVF